MGALIFHQSQGATYPFVLTPFVSQCNSGLVPLFVSIIIEGKICGSVMGSSGGNVGSVAAA